MNLKKRIAEIVYTTWQEEGSVNETADAILKLIRDEIDGLRKPTFQCECDSDKSDHCSCGARDREIEQRAIGWVLEILGKGKNEL